MNPHSQKQQILEAASSLFYQNGYSNTTIETVIQTAKVDAETFKTYYEDKEELCLAYLKHTNESFFKRVISFLDQIPSEKGKILGIFENLELFYQMEGFNGCWGLNIYSEVASVSEKIRTEILSQKSMLLEFILEKIRSITPAQSEVCTEGLSQKVYLLLEGAVIESNLMKKQWPITRSKEICESLLKDI